MKKFITQHKNEILIIAFIAILGIIYFSYNMTITWDTSEYLGLADFIGTEKMAEKWIGHRGIAFPLLLKLFKPFGIENKIFMLILMFIFYVMMVITIYKIYKKLNKHQFFKNKIMKLIFAIYTIYAIILNPIIFGYYHTLLTEFVSTTIALLMCYLCWKWIDLTWKKDKKNIIIYTIVFSILTVVLYHVKQSLVPLGIIPILSASLISIINNFKLSNILTKITTTLSVIIILMLSIFSWNFAMKEANVAEDTKKARVDGYLIKGVVELSEKDELDRSQGDIIAYCKILFNKPLIIAKSYYNNYWKIVFLQKENFVIPYRMYQNRINIVDVNKDYEQFIENYTSVNQINAIANIFNKYVYKVLKPITIFLQVSLWILPITWIVSVIVYIIINRKVSQNTLKILQFIVILYTTAFGSIMSYIIFSATVDRYTVPMMIPTFIAHFLSMTLLTRIKIKKKS